MASLIETLVNTLEKENDEYVKLFEISKQKTPIIVKGDIDALRDIVAKEQYLADNIAALEHTRTETVKDIAVVLNKDADTLTIRDIINLLKEQDAIQQRLSEVHGRIRTTVQDMIAINNINKSLIEDSLEMAEFNINLINSFKGVPEVNNYTKNAYSVNSYVEPPRFDAKN